MRCAELAACRPQALSRTQAARLGLATLVAAVLAGCGSAPTAPEAPPARTTAPARPAPAATAPATPAAPEARAGVLPPPARPRDMDDLRIQAARRLVAANPSISYMGKPPELLLAIPVMSIELHGDGSVKSISVLRHPSQALDTEDMARQAIMRAAPFGDVTHLPKPWKFTETFLFNKERKFKPMTLDRL